MHAGPTAAARRLADAIAAAAADLAAGRPIAPHADSLRRLVAEMASAPGDVGVLALMQALGPALDARGVAMPPLDRFPPSVAAFLEAADEVFAEDSPLDFETAADRLERAAAAAFGTIAPREARAQALREQIRREVSASIADTLRAQGLTPAADMQGDEATDTELEEARK
ncbi:hypothetical protein WMF20_45165 [Sorangium sp. So ce834]|uniref:hypothetical protein n=1 Tax=Sorangium sp. So ce834 TaxID=3133321 RepID=UPI003F612D6C